MNMRIFTLITTMSLLLFMGCTAAEEYIKIEDSETGMTYSVSKSTLDWFDKGAQLYTKGSYESAIMCFDKAIELDPSYAPPWINKGFCLKSLGRYDEALNAFDNATRLNPLNPDLWTQKGDILLEQDKYEEAIKAYNISIEQDPDSSVWFNKGVAFANQGKYDEAINCFNEVIKQNTTKKLVVAAWQYKGNALKELGEYRNNGNLLYQQGKYADAINCLHEAIKLDPQDSELWVDMGHLLRMQNKYDEALKSYDKALEINPQDAYALGFKNYTLTEMRQDTNETVAVTLNSTVT